MRNRVQAYHNWAYAQYGMLVLCFVMAFVVTRFTSGRLLSTNLIGNEYELLIDYAVNELFHYILIIKRLLTAGDTQTQKVSSQAFAKERSSVLRACGQMFDSSNRCNYLRSPHSLRN